MAVDLAEAAAYSGDIALAIRANDLLIKDPWPQTNPTQHAARAVVSGVASLAGGNRRVAVELLTQAVAAFRTSGWSLLEGRALALLGTAIARHDRARAVETLAQAAERFGSCGAVVRRERALACLARLSTKGRRKRVDLVGPGSLSAREREVARLASQAFPAREVAERLFISERTVESHLANVYAKLGVASKMELIRRAGTLGI